MQSEDIGVDADHVAETAAMWVARLQSSDATEHDREEFRLWLAQNSAHARAYEEFQALWTDLKDVPIPQGRLRSLQRTRHTRVAGAGLLLVAVVLGAGAADRMGLVDRWRADHYTVIGQVRTIPLEDGSRVTLNTDTAVIVDYSAGTRHIELLRGEAFFDVAHDPQRPFVVEDGTLAAKAIGTRYSVRTASGAAADSVQVEEGRVEVSTGQDMAMLDPGSVATLGDNGRLRVDHADVTRTTAWRDGMLVFSEQPLREVLATLERYRRGRILVVDEAAGRLSVSGVFELEDTDRALQILAESLPLSITYLTDMMVVVRSR